MAMQRNDGVAGLPNDLFLVNPPIRFHWLGWETTTERLGRNGWDVSVRKHPNEYSHSEEIQIAIRHSEANVYGFCNTLGINKYGYHHPREWMKYLRNLETRLDIAKEIHFHDYHVNFGWKAVETDPSVVEINIDRISTADIFQPLPDKRLIVAPPSFNQILDMALEHQAPKQKEIREKMRRIKHDEGALIRVAV